MKNTRTGHFVITGADAAVNLGALIAAVADFKGMSRIFSKIRIFVPEDAGGVVEVSMTNSAAAAPASSAASNFIAIGDSREYEQVNADLVWINSTADTVVEFAGNPA